MGKLRVSGGGVEIMPKNGSFLAAIRAPQNGPSSDDDILSMIFPENPGQPMGLQNGPFSLANHGRGLPKLWVN